MDILGIGMSTLDAGLRLPEFPSDGGVTEAIDSSSGGGGPVPTALCAASRYGASAAILDRIGGDWRGERIRADYEAFGVSTRHLLEDTGRISSFSDVLVRERDGERHVIFHRGNFRDLDESDLPVEDLDHCRFLHLNGRHWPACVRAAERVRRSGGMVSFDGGAGRFDPKFRELLALVDVLVVARDFAEKLSDSAEREAQFLALSEWGASVVGITDGENGSWFCTSEDGAFHQPAFPVEVVDTTGCGDVFHGVLLAARCGGGDWKEAARHASAAAAINATALGGRGKLPTRSEIGSFLESAKE